MDKSLQASVKIPLKDIFLYLCRYTKDFRSLQIDYFIDANVLGLTLALDSSFPS